MIIEFDDGVQLVPRSWLIENKTKCYYPNDHDLGNGPNVPKKYDLMVKSMVLPKINWNIYNVKHILGSDGMYKLLDILNSIYIFNLLNLYCIVYYFR